MRIDDKDAEEVDRERRDDRAYWRAPIQWAMVTRDQRIIVGEVRSITPVTLPVPSSA